MYDMHDAAARGDLATVLKLCEAGNDVNEKRSTDNLTPLHLAAGHGHTAVLQALLHCGANIRLGSPYWTPLHRAARYGQVAAARLLLAAGAEIDRGTQDEEMTPLHLAVLHGHVEVVRLLLECKAAVDTVSVKGKTPLHYAASDGNVAVVRLLGENGAALDREGRWVETPLHFAARYGHTGTVRVLLELGADVHGGMKSEFTPLHVAISRADVETVRVLMARGARLDPREETPPPPRDNFYEVLTGPVEASSRGEEYYVALHKLHDMLPMVTDFYRARLFYTFAKLCVRSGVCPTELCDYYLSKMLEKCALLVKCEKTRATYAAMLAYAQEKRVIDCPTSQRLQGMTGIDGAEQPDFIGEAFDWTTYGMRCFDGMKQEQTILTEGPERLRKSMEHFIGALDRGDGLGIATGFVRAVVHLLTLEVATSFLGDVVKMLHSIVDLADVVHLQQVAHSGNATMGSDLQSMLQQTEGLVDKLTSKDISATIKIMVLAKLMEEPSSCDKYLTDRASASCRQDLADARGVTHEVELPEAVTRMNDLVSGYELVSEKQPGQDATA
mmetsp:Transcript_2640/g.9560  ORF Transcript_2640/g.9560 Transcript_2640/m.9560 type:complete len:557 (-) Transcript_2640:528-2198(-)